MLTQVYWIDREGTRAIKAWTRFEPYMLGGTLCQDWRGNVVVKVLVRTGKGSNWESASAANLVPIT